MASNFAATDAGGYELMMGRWSRLLAKPFLEFAGAVTDARIVDIGCGTGSLEQALLPALGNGSVAAVDVSPAYVAHGKTLIDDPRVAFDVADATKLPFADGSFDLALSQLVLNFVPEYRSAIAEMRRVTRRGCVVAATVWDFEGGLQMNRMIWDAAAVLDDEALRGRARTYSGPLIHEGELSAAFVEQGLRDVEARDILVWMRFASFADYWKPYLAGQGLIGAYVAKLPGDKQTKLEGVMREAYCAGRPDGQRSYAGVARAVKGREPG